MIDAYEIGIQLLLQEDVSAGLEVINRGLADVDRAIAATSADLAGLAAQAGTATKAVAAAVSGRATPAPASGQKPGETAEPIASKEGEADRTAGPRSEGEQTGAAPTASSQEKVAAPNAKAMDPSLPAELVTGLPREAVARPQPPAPEQNLSSSAPVRTDTDKPVRDGQLGNKTTAEPESPMSAVSARVETVAPSAGERGPPSVQRVPLLGTELRPSKRPSSHPVALTASVSRAQRPASASATSERARQSPIAGSATQRERTAAPWSGVDHVGRRAETTRSRDKAAAPQPQGRNDNQSGGGTVMLDGRLVGQWLSDHLGREASRPPSGTTFFDPRQTPAWNVSGAL